MTRLIVLKEKELRQLKELLGGFVGNVLVVEKGLLEELGHTPSEAQESLNEYWRTTEAELSLDVVTARTGNAAYLTYLLEEQEEARNV